MARASVHNDVEILQSSVVVDALHNALHDDITLLRFLECESVLVNWLLDLDWKVGDGDLIGKKKLNRNRVFFY